MPAACVAFVMGTAGWFLAQYRKAGAALLDAEAAAAAGVARVDSMALEPQATAGVEWIGGAASGYLDAAFFQGRFFLLSSSELAEYDASNGTLIRRYRSGFEFPSTALLSLSQGVAWNAKQPELLLATADHGYLAFDGQHWRQVRIPGKLLGIYPLPNGRVLLPTDRAGLQVHDARGLTPFHDSLKSKRVTAIAGATEAHLWIGTMDEGLFHYRAGQLVALGPLPDKRVLWIAEDGPRVFAATPMGIAEFDSEGTFQRTLAEGFFVQTLHPTPNGELLAGTLEDGLLAIPLAARKARPRPRELEGKGEIRKIFAAGGREFTLTPTRLLSGDREVLKADANLLSDGNIAALAPDAGGRLWIGYFDRGLDIWSPNGGVVKHVEDDIIFCVNRVVHDGQRSLVATGNGLAFFDNGSVSLRRTMHKPDGLIANHVTDILLSRDGSLTVATPAGVTFLDPNGGQPSSIYAFHGLVNNHVYALASCNGQLLAGTLGGLSMLEGGLVKASFTTANSALRHNWISGIVDAGGGACLIGTYGEGVMSYENGTWKSFPGLGRFEVNPNAMAASARAAYAGSLGKGLAVWNRATGRWSWVTAGLPSLNVTAVATSGEIVYVGTDNGLVKIDERTLLVR